MVCRNNEAFRSFLVSLLADWLDDWFSLIPHLNEAEEGKAYNEQTLFLKVLSLGKIQGVPHLRGFHYRGSPYCEFWLMCLQVGDFLR
jgi:hypothetical protein